MIHKQNLPLPLICAVATLFLTFPVRSIAAGGTGALLNEPLDVSPDFYDFTNLYYLADRLSDFDPATGAGKITWQRAQYFTRQAFDHMASGITTVGPNEFPGNEYEANPVLPFSLEFVSPNTVRIRAKTGPQITPESESLMLVGGKAPKDNSWKYEKIDGGHRYSNVCGSVTVLEKPWHIELRDPAGRLLTKTYHLSDRRTTIYAPILPFAFVRRSKDYSRSVAAAFTLSPGEKIFGCGESFTGLDKRGQKVVLSTDDASGVESRDMYKPIPFFMSSRGYGMFMHTSSPITCDFGSHYSGIDSLMLGDDELDLFIFFGTPKEILDAYTTLTGKASMPPLWSFGLWMSRITYSTEDQVRDVTAKLRQNRIPSDVIHLDTGWFETDWRCDYEFSKSRFKDPQKMIADLKKDGFRISLWQLPYFVPKNKLFPEIIAKGLYVRDAKGGLPDEDAILDFSNPAAVAWYQEKIGNLLRMGVGAIKVDFGEAAPYNGLYASGRTGFYEHNLYPLRYNKTVADVTRQVTGENIIWARSAWTGSQRYPLHWGGDAENTDMGMAATLRGGLSFGLSGFSFWSHDIGGFVTKPPRELYRRWVPFGMLTSHSRCHGAPPKEPWEYGESFMNDFRRADELKYRLMPYIYAQAKDCTQRGLPMLRALLIEYPDDPGSWLVEDEYLFGSDLLVAPLLEESAGGRNVYLPPGVWIDYQSGKAYRGGQWRQIDAGTIPIVLLVKDHSVIPHIGLAQCTADMDWNNVELHVFSTDQSPAAGLFALPNGNLQTLKLEAGEKGFALKNDPLPGKVNWLIKKIEIRD
ncbi:MAG: alpha-xylosidase [Thermoguttaceae bacterium]|jgi:alpha-D-xyloside xylohydrolase